MVASRPQRGSTRRKPSVWPAAKSTRRTDAIRYKEAGLIGECSSGGDLTARRGSRFTAAVTYTPGPRANLPKRAMESFAVGRPSLTVCPPTASSLRSEEHTSELQSQSNIVCRLLLEKKIPNVQIALDA